MVGNDAFYAFDVAIPNFIITFVENTVKFKIFREVLKGNVQFIFLRNPQKSGALRICIIFSQITQKNTN